MEEVISQNLFYFRIYANFEADKEIDNSSQDNKTTKKYGQNPVCNYYCRLSELNNISQNGNYECPLVYDHVHWFVIEVIKLEKKLTLFFKNTKEVMVMSEEDGKPYS